MNGQINLNEISNVKARGNNRAILNSDLLLVIEHLANDQSLEPKYRDHSLSGNWKDHRDCHIKPDLVLIYKKFGKETLQLVRLGSHRMLSL